ncbi:hypothetical protein [Citrobacter portucalensis]|uniref:hypothetical protein n=1 Tax=Citrobacter portucalensis TaxID=1639133 RepID=UPI00288907E3|nr:hypothetical protein [Citrobacter portucalensis]WNI84139.1 hypothetical protein RIK60_00375 [Citrobacter portucalensis]
MDTMMMLRNAVISGIMLTAPLLARAGIVADSGRPINFAGCYPYRTLYFSYTEDHKKAVEVCRVGKDYGVYRYTYGPINKPELQVLKTDKDIGWYESYRSVGFAMRNGNYYYHLETTRDPRKGSFTLLVVSKGSLSGKIIASIPLANDYYGFQYDLSRDGLLVPFPVEK